MLKEIKMGREEDLLIEVGGLKVFTQDNLAKFLLVSRPTLDRMVREDTFPRPFNVAGRRNFWTPESIHKWMSDIQKGKIKTRK